MHYYIDGYNLLFRFSNHKNDFTSMREEMIRDLDLQATSLQLKITIVFDAQYQLGEFCRTHFRSIEILYTAFGELADELILSEIRTKTAPHRITVVTSDKKLAWFARRCDAKTESVEHFRAWINRRYHNKVRREIEVKQAKKVIPQKKEAAVPLSPQKPLKPLKSASVEECHHYYQEQFEERLKVEEVVQEVKRTKRTIAKGSKKPKQQKHKVDVESDPVSEMERWLKLFEG